MANGSNNQRVNSNKVSLDYITDWKSGELLTEYKLKAIFEVIGNAINGIDSEIGIIENVVSQLRLALRWLGSFDTWQQYQAWELQHKDDSIFQSPNNPLPTAGDVILIGDSSTMPEGSMPPGYPQGRYIFIYTQQLDFGTGQVTKYGWELYNPLALPNASRVNDGLMSKEMFIKLDDLKTQEDINEVLTNYEERINSNKDRLDKLEPQVKKNTTYLEDLKPRVSSLETNKQDVATNITGFQSKTVTDNLREVNEKVNHLSSELSQAEITIWQPEDKTVKLTTQSGSFLVTSFNFNAEDVKFLGDSYVRAYISFNNINDPGNVHSLSITMKNIKETNSNFTTKSTETAYMRGATNDEICEITTWISKLGTGSYRLNVEIKPEKLIPNTNYAVQYEKLIKDVGVSDYMMAEQITEDLQEFLQGNLGLKRKLVTSKPNGDSKFNKGDVIDLGFDYLVNANAIVVFQGGTKLLQNVVWEEMPGTDNYKSHQIKVLQDLDLAKDGELEITAASVILNSYQVKYWNSQDQFIKGEVVYHNGRMFFCKVTNVNKEPPTTSPYENDYWQLLQFEIDLENLEARIKDYVYSVSLEQAKKAIETHDKGNAVYFIKNEISEYKDRTDLTSTVEFLQRNKAFILSETGEKTYVTFENVSSLIEDIYHTGNTNIVIKWLDTIYATQLAEVKVLQATPQEITTEINAQLAKYTQGIPTEYADTVQIFASLEEYNRFKQAHGLTDEDFIDVTPDPMDTSQYATKSYVENVVDTLESQLVDKVDADFVEKNYLNIKTTQTQEVKGETNFAKQVTIKKGLRVIDGTTGDITSDIQSWNTSNRKGLTVTGDVNFTKKIYVQEQPVTTKSDVENLISATNIKHVDIPLSLTVQPGNLVELKTVKLQHQALGIAKASNQYMYSIVADDDAHNYNPLAYIKPKIIPGTREPDKVTIYGRSLSTSAISINCILRIIYWGGSYV